LSTAILALRRRSVFLLEDDITSRSGFQLNGNGMEGVAVLKMLVSAAGATSASMIVGG
jgi:hypothetical protein